MFAWVRSSQEPNPTFQCYKNFLGVHSLTGKKLLNLDIRKRDLIRNQIA